MPIVALLLAAGCTTSSSDAGWRDAAVGNEPFPVAAEEPALSTSPLNAVEAALEQARTLYEQGALNEALMLCVDLSRTHPYLPGLVELRMRILNAANENRTIEAAEASDRSKQQMAIEAVEAAALPETYGLERFVEGVDGSHQIPGSEIQRILDMPVTIHLEGADLGAFIQALSQDENINIIADEGLAAGKKIDIAVDEVPIKELLDYISRNFDVQFYFGQSVIWATAAAKPEAMPMETRIFHFRHGLQFHGSDWKPPGERRPQDSDLQSVSLKATVLAEETNYVINLITQFVPQPEGAHLYLDENTHALFARNSPENLDLLARILDEIDVVPPQVLIEARYVEVLVADLRELGIDWILDSPLVVSRKGVMMDGNYELLTRTQVDPGEIFSAAPYRSDEEGSFPLGPQGPFGLRRTGNPPTDDQGLNITYRGTLTEPMFQAVLHALEISGKGRTLSVPRVTTVNNHPAKLRNGEDLLYYEEFAAQAFSLLDDNNKKYTITVLIPKGKPSLSELGITLVAVPSVGSNLRTINLLLTPTLSELEGFVSYQDAPLTNSVVGAVRQVVVKLPIISIREVQTKVVVESGETVVLGGLIQTVNQETVHRVPVMGSIPVLGKLFSRVGATEQQRNLLIFVTATVLSERGESLVASRPPPEPPPDMPAMDASGRVIINQ